MKSKSVPRLIVLAAAWLGGVTLALAQSPQAGYPTKVVKILAPYSSGAGPSIFMRIMGDKLAKAWGQQVIVDSRPGASGFIAIAAAKANPGRLTYGAPYVGSPSHLGAADLEYRTGTKMVLVPYKDQPQIYASIANGDLDWMLSTLGSALPLLKAGRIKLIAVA